MFYARTLRHKRFLSVTTLDHCAKGCCHVELDEGLHNRGTDGFGGEISSRCLSIFRIQMQFLIISKFHSVLRVAIKQGNDYKDAGNYDFGFPKNALIFSFAEVQSSLL